MFFLVTRHLTKSKKLNKQLPVLSAFDQALDSLGLL